VHLLTLKTMFDGSVLLRLQHVFADGEDATLSQPVSVNVGSLFSVLTPVSMQETTLTANRPLSELKKQPWGVAGSHAGAQYAPVKDFVVQLSPQQIRTFLVRFVAK